MNPGMQHLHPYPFQKMEKLLGGLQPTSPSAAIDLSIGEPKHPTPRLVVEALQQNLQGLAQYPKIAGTDELRAAISEWLQQRFSLPQKPDPASEIISVNGTREALFAIAQCLIDSGKGEQVLIPNPGYQIYEGAALLAGAVPTYLPLSRETDFVPQFDQVAETVWRNTRLVYLCSPGNPCGGVASIDSLQQLIKLAHRHEFVIASDECYSEIYRDEAAPPPGLLQAAAAMGETSYRNCLVFHSLSKRSNAPGMRSGFVAGDARLIQQFRQYRTYHGCAMPPPFQSASIAAWGDETHVQENRQQYRQKFDLAEQILTPYGITAPPASFYLWLPTPIDDQLFTQRLYSEQAVKVIPGSFLGRDGNQSASHGQFVSASASDRNNPGRHYVRCALVAPVAECEQGLRRIAHLLEQVA
ncbi:MAG TPA: succinyldiaminopimelate transaminase [Gammaproteobacteria bacterium]|nr:succinyldiaminopimelate transaminase [Gammaproteobacteria bacterium]